MSEREVPGAGASGAGVAAGVQVMGTADAARVDAAVELRGVRFAYGEHAVLDGLSLALPAGCLTGVVGPNGCGKSTLLRVIDGVLEPAAGEALVEGDALDSLSARERAERIALLPQIHRTPSMTVEALVSCGRYAHMGLFGGLTEQDRQIVADSMRVAGVEHLAHKAARALSGGERQRAFVAMVLAQRARTVLLDEPTTYLDPRAALDVMGLARGLVYEQGMTGAVVIHDLPLALRFCDRIAVMDGGRIVAVGTPAEILDQGVLEQVFGVMIARMELNGEVVYSCC